MCHDIYAWLLASLLQPWFPRLTTSLSFSLLVTLLEQQLFSENIIIVLDYQLSFSLLVILLKEQLFCQNIDHCAWLSALFFIAGNSAQKEPFLSEYWSLCLTISSLFNWDQCAWPAACLMAHKRMCQHIKWMTQAFYRNTYTQATGGREQDAWNEICNVTNHLDHMQVYTVCESMPKAFERKNTSHDKDLIQWKWYLHQQFQSYHLATQRLEQTESWSDFQW